MQLIDADDGSVVATTTTDRNGNYSFGVADGVGTGQYQVTMIPPDGSTVGVKTSRVVSITRGNQFIDLDFLYSLLGQSDPTGGGRRGGV